MPRHPCPTSHPGSSVPLAHPTAPMKSQLRPSSSLNPGPSNKNGSSGWVVSDGEGATGGEREGRREGRYQSEGGAKGQSMAVTCGEDRRMGGTGEQ